MSSRTKGKEESLRSKKPLDKRQESRTKPSTDKKRREGEERNGQHQLKQEGTTASSTTHSKSSKPSQPLNPLASKPIQPQRHSTTETRPSPKQQHRSPTTKLKADTKPHSSVASSLSDHSLSYSSKDHKSSPKLSQSTKRLEAHVSKNSDLHIRSPKLSSSHSSKNSKSHSSESSTKETHRQGTTDRHEGKRGRAKPHPLHEVHHNNSDEEIVEETEQDERDRESVGIGIDPIPMEEVSEEIPQEDNGGADDYLNEEFEEDYEEDFEEASNGSVADDKRESSPSSDIDDVLQAIGQENERVEDESSQLLQVISPSAPLPPPHLSPRPSMTFSGATQKLKETSIKIKTRGAELSHMIEKDTLSINLFELQPLTEYGMYMRSFGQANTSQTGTQTGQDMIEEESQTEDVTSKDCWTQWPPHDMKGYGRYDDEDGDDSYAVYDTEKLIKFLQRASQVCDVLLEEDELYDATNDNNGLRGREGDKTRGDRYCTLESSLSINGDIKCIDVSLSLSDILVTGSMCNKEDWTGLLEVWHLSRIQKHPQYVLGDQSVPSSICVLFPLVFAGNDDGTVVLWDLREPVSLHRQHSLTDTDRETIIRAPTYTTAAMGTDNESGHCQPVIHVETSGATQHSTVNDWHVQGLSFQLLSLDASGRVCVWVIVELPEGDSSGSPVDLGLAPGGRVKLISSATMDVLFGSEIAHPIATSLNVSKADSNTLLIGTDSGAVIRHVRYRPRAVPKQYLINDNMATSSEVTSISIHPHFLSHFLVSYSSGHIGLYDIRWAHPVITWPSGRQSHLIRELNWHPKLSNVFICVGEDNNVHIWDLLTDDTGPVHTLKLEKKIICMGIAPDQNDPNSLSLVLSSEDGVSIYRLDSRKLYHDNHLELFETFISENSYNIM